MVDVQRDASRLACALPVLVIAIAGCAQMVATEPSQLQAPAPERQAIVVVRDTVEIKLPTGYSRTIVSGSRWRHVGSVPQGDVYRPLDGVFTVEGRQVHEAFLVVSGPSLKGFYLPGEGNYAPLRSPTPIRLGESR